MVEAKGRGGQMSFDGDFVTIHRRGFLARMGQGKGDKRIPVASITSVDMKPAGAVMNGFIALTLAGAIEGKSSFGDRSFKAAKDPNSVMFTKKQEPESAELRTEIEATIAARNAPQPAAAASADPVAQLAQLAAMHDAGSLTDEEFAQMKAQLVRGA
jgi:Domain of unknown function (DUF4429)/Short C-terminal domain